jgi:tRNA (mo5U34)-methyltransferase
VLKLEDQVEFRRMQVYNLAQEETRWDLVIFMGVLYHLRYPMLGLDIVSQKVRRLMVFQTMTMPGEELVTNTSGLSLEERDKMLQEGWPKMAFIEYELQNDPTNWWAPNHACVEAMLRSSGMRITGRPGHEIYLCEPDPGNSSCITTWKRDEFLAATRLRSPHG